MNEAIAAARDYAHCIDVLTGHALEDCTNWDSNVTETFEIEAYLYVIGSLASEIESWLTPPEVHRDRMERIKAQRQQLAN